MRTHLLFQLMSVNCANFDFPACNFTERNMYMKDRHTGAGHEGSGRVSAYKATGLVQSYTLEANFNTGRLVNCVPQARSLTFEFGPMGEESSRESLEITLICECRLFLSVKSSQVHSRKMPNKSFGIFLMSFGLFLNDFWLLVKLVSALIIFHIVKGRYD